MTDTKIFAKKGPQKPPLEERAEKKYASLPKASIKKIKEAVSFLKSPPKQDSPKVKLLRYVNADDIVYKALLYNGTNSSQLSILEPKYKDFISSLNKDNLKEDYLQACRTHTPFSPAMQKHISKFIQDAHVFLYAHFQALNVKSLMSLYVQKVHLLQNLSSQKRREEFEKLPEDKKALLLTFMTLLQKRQTGDQARLFGKALEGQKIVLVPNHEQISFENFNKKLGKINLPKLPVGPSKMVSFQTFGSTDALEDEVHKAYGNYKKYLSSLHYNPPKNAKEFEKVLKNMNENYTQRSITARIYEQLEGRLEAIDKAFASKTSKS